MNKIYDCFSFYNEFDLLKIRLEELFDVVDYFVISEANTTHSGKEKDFLLWDNWDLVKPYQDKIIYVNVSDMPGVIDGNCWHNERHQRNSLIRGLTHAHDDDIILIGDVDELVRASSVEEIINDYKHNCWGFRMPMFNYRFNYMWTTPLIYQVQTQAMTVERAKTYRDLSYIREIYGTCWANRPNVYSDDQDFCLQHAGWHFSSLGNNDFVANKLRSFAHSELAHQADTIDIEQLIAENKTSLRPDARFDPVKLDDYFPQALLKNKENYKHLIIENADQSVMEKLACLV